jgi:hypothetical protein
MAMTMPAPAEPAAPGPDGGGGDDGEPGGPDFRLRILTRCRVAQLRLVPGAVLRVRHDLLQVAAHLVRTGSARPADAHTAAAVELALRLQAAIPPAR